MLLEVYAKIEGFENYAVSNLGNVLNIKTGDILKHQTNKGYKYVGLHKNSLCKKKYVHRLVAFAYLDKIIGKNLVDHIDCNPLNNCITNLRFCNHIENMRNVKIPTTNTSSVKGVYYNKNRNKWIAQIKVNGKVSYLGCYETLELAKIARQNKSRELFGDFLNDCEK